MGSFDQDVVYDVVFLGGGLAGCLAALRLASVDPKLKIAIVERGPKLGGDHTWSFHGSDIEPAGQWIFSLETYRWENYDVFFPSLTREISGTYHCILSENLHEICVDRLGKNVILNTSGKCADGQTVILSNGTSLSARCVIDSKGGSPSGSRFGYQKFLGQRLRFAHPHGISRPVLMDNLCPQIDGFRFFYLLPFSESELLIEDTRYSRDPLVDRVHFRSEISRYASRRGWDIAEMLYEEVGSLPIPLDTSDCETRIPTIGGAANLFHPTTGYSLPYAVRVANFLATVSPLTTDHLKSVLVPYARRLRRSAGLFRLLNRCLFDGTSPGSMFKIFEKFYRLPESTIGRFYSGNPGLIDVARIFSGKPPISLPGFFRSLTGARR